MWMPLFAGGQSAAAPPPVSLHSEADLVLVDVVITDSARNPVHGLKAADLTLLENGHEQIIKTLEEHKFAPAATLPPLPKLSPGVFTNYTPTPGSGSLNILLLDSLNTPMADQTFSHDQVLKYLNEARPGTRMAIFGLTTHLRLLQGFTSDPDLLRAVMNGKQDRSKGSPLMNNAVAGDSPGADDTLVDLATETLGNSPTERKVLANLQQFQAEQQSTLIELRARYTLDAFNQLGRYLSGLPGRKNLIWFSGSFPINIQPDGDLEYPFNVVASAEDEFRETTDLFARSHVAVYPIDARGLMISPVNSVANSGNSLARSASVYGKADAKFLVQTADEHSTMERIAEATGGEAFVNTNGLTQAVEKEQSMPVPITTRSAPRPPIANGRASIGRFKSRLNRPGLTLAYRRGYYADDPRVTVHASESRDLKPATATHPTIPCALLCREAPPILPNSSSRPASAPFLRKTNQTWHPPTTPPQRQPGPSGATPSSFSYLREISLAMPLPMECASAALSH